MRMTCQSKLILQQIHIVLFKIKCCHWMQVVRIKRLQWPNISLVRCHWHKEGSFTHALNWSFVLHLYADDIVLVGETFADVQFAINELQHASLLFAMKINTSKTKIFLLSFVTTDKTPIHLQWWCSWRSWRFQISWSYHHSHGWR